MPGAVMAPWSKDGMRLRTFSWLQAWRGDDGKSRAAPGTRWPLTLPPFPLRRTLDRGLPHNETHVIPSAAREICWRGAENR
jgi:hypothetical protein